MTTDDPEIIINGTKLDTGQIMTLRAVCTYTHSEFSEDMNALGSDMFGQAMTRTYLARLDEILTLMMAKN